MSATQPAQNPIQLFTQLLEQAKQLAIPEPNAMILGTVDEKGNPTTRVVLLKGVDERGFVFYTNLQSQKGRHLLAHPQASLCFFWAIMQKQVRVEGPVQQVTHEEADAYFATRPRGSQIGAWASLQSSVLPSRELLESRVAELEEKYRNQPVPRPPHWSGFRLVPETVEVWTGRDSRLHERQVFRRSGAGWTEHLIYP